MNDLVFFRTSRCFAIDKSDWSTESIPDDYLAEGLSCVRKLRLDGYVLMSSNTYLKLIRLSKSSTKTSNHAL